MIKENFNEEETKDLIKNYSSEILDTKEIPEISFLPPWVHDQFQDILAYSRIRESNELLNEWRANNVEKYSKVNLWSQVVCTNLFKNQLFQQEMHPNLELIGISNKMINDFIFELVSKLEKCVDSGYLHGYSYMIMPTSLLWLPTISVLDEKSAVKDNSIAIAAQTRAFTYNLNNFKDSCVDSFFSTIGRNFTFNRILSIYIPFIYNVGDRTQFFMRYNLTDVKNLEMQS